MLDGCIYMEQESIIRSCIRQRMKNIISIGIFRGVTVLLVRYLQQQTVLRQGRYLTMSLYTDII